MQNEENKSCDVHSLELSFVSCAFSPASIINHHQYTSRQCLRYTKYVVKIFIHVVSKSRAKSAKKKYIPLRVQTDITVIVQKIMQQAYSFQILPEDLRNYVHFIFTPKER